MYFPSFERGLWEGWSSCGGGYIWVAAWTLPYLNVAPSDIKNNMFGSAEEAVTASMLFKHCNVNSDTVRVDGTVNTLHRNSSDIVGDRKENILCRYKDTYRWARIPKQETKRWHGNHMWANMVTVVCIKQLGQQASDMTCIFCTIHTRTTVQLKSLWWLLCNWLQILYFQIWQVRDQLVPTVIRGIVWERSVWTGSVTRWHEATFFSS